MPSVLFVCTANQFRSPIAAARLRSKLIEENRSGAWNIASAGTWTTPDLPALPFARELAHAYGISLDDHRTQLVSRTQMAEFDLVLVMEAGHQEALLTEFPFASGYLFLLSEVVDGIRYDVHNPTNSFDEAAKCIADLHALIERGYESICSLAEAICVSHA
jgi:protein-tyrosine phosphatase